MIRHVVKSARFRLAFLCYRIKYYLVKRKACSYNVASDNDTIQKILDDRVSISRYGNGEFGWICGIKYDNFEELSTKMAFRLREVLEVPTDNHIVGIMPVMGMGLKEQKGEGKKYWQYILGKDGLEWSSYLNKKKMYYSSFITRPYIDTQDYENASHIFASMKKIWEGKNVLIVEGPYGRMGVGNDLLRSSQSVRRIIAPSRNAFRKYEEIHKKILKYVKDDVVLISLGPTATVLAYDLSKDGVWAIDIGQIDIEYEWFLAKATAKQPIKGKFVNEAGGMDTFEEFDEELLTKYNGEIIDVVEG